MPQRHEGSRANCPGEPIGFTYLGRLEHPTRARARARRGYLARSATRDKVAELGSSEGLHVILTSGTKT